jgi:hypothetical protein
MGAVQEAHRGLIGAGFGAALSASANRRGGLNGATPEEQCVHLVEIAACIGEADPLMIGAAWLLEQEGYERSQLDLFSGGRES